MKPSIQRTARIAALASMLALMLAATGCTTTVRQVTETRPVLRNSAPSTMSELRIADTALQSNNFELATSLYEKIVQADPKSVPGLTGLGNTLYGVGDFTRAGVYYQRASQIDPKATPPLIGIARVAIHQRRFADAIATYHRVLAITPNDPLACAGLGAALDLSGDHARAQALLREALIANPGDPRQGANVLLDVTRFPAAPPQARQNLALAYGLLGNDEAAAAILSRDLPKASVRDNLRYYELQRERDGQTSAQPSKSVAVSAIATPKVQTASVK